MAKLVYIATHGPDDPTRACMPIHLAVNGAAEAGIEAEINLAGDAAVPIQDAYVAALLPLGFPPPTELLAKAQDTGTHVFVRGGCAQARGVSQADLGGKNASFATPPDLARRCAEATNVLVF